MIAMWHAHHLQDIYRDFRCELPVTESIEKRFTILPFHSRLAEEEVRVICDKLLEEIGGK